MKKRFSLMLAMLMTLALLTTACSGDASKPTPPPAAPGGSSTAQPTQQSAAPDWPKKDITLVVPYAAGGDTDIAARTLAKYLTLSTGVNVVVTNATGASGSVAYETVNDAQKDGYTLLFCHNGLLNGYMLGLTELGYEDFEPAGSAISADAQCWAVLTSSPYETMQDVVDSLKAKPNSVSFGTLYGNFTHLESLAFMSATDTQIKLVDVGAASECLANLLGGHVDMVSAQWAVIKDYVKDGQIRVLGCVNGERSACCPDVPTMLEQDVGFSFDKNFLMLAPKGTPSDVIDAFSEAVKKVTENPDFQKDIAGQDLVVKFYTPDELKTYMDETYESYLPYKDKATSGSF